MRKKTTLLRDSEIGDGTIIWDFAVVYNSTIGNNVNIGCHCEIGNAIIGNNTRIGKGVFMCNGVKIGDNCFIGPMTCFSNDKMPKVANCDKIKPLKTKVENSANIGANCTILPGITIGTGSTIGAGSVVTKNVPPFEIWYGNPAHPSKIWEKLD